MTRLNMIYKFYAFAHFAIHSLSTDLLHISFSTVTGDTEVNKTDKVLTFMKLTF